jgi:anti-sigma factor RsiW
MSEACQEMRFLVQADVDGMLTPAEAARVALHLETCAACAALQTKLLALSEQVRAQAPRFAAPASLRSRLLDAHGTRAALPQSAPRLAPWRSLGFGTSPALASGLAMAACLAVAILVWPATDPAQDVVSAHIRALLPGHLTDVASSDQHTVKPWFDGRLPFAPSVKDLKSVGFPLIGGRLDYVDRRLAAALVYRHDAHEINVFVWPDDTAPKGASRGTLDGYNFERWSVGGMTYWAVSDLNSRDLADFGERWRAF